VTARLKRKSAPHSNRNKVLIQALRTMMILRRGRWTMFELADELRVGWRTAYRIVDGIRRVGIEVETSEDGPAKGPVHYRISAESVRRALRL
jgi:predicted DNA-binding transcriptional regulator YafY